MRRIGVAATVLTALTVPILPSSPAWAQTQLATEVEAAKSLMLIGRSSEARALLEQLATSHSGNNEIEFLLGMIAVEAQDYDEAIRRFRSILARQPGAVRVRLELARAFFLDRDYENAFRNFQLARAGELPPGVGETIDRFVSLIRQRKTWSYSLSVSLAPDSNINNGTSAREVNLFGLPFELSADARERSGVGLAIEGSAEFAPRISETTRFRMGAAIQRNEYDGTDFDDMTVAVHAGPRIVRDKWDFSVTGTAFQRRFGRQRLNEGIGARVEATRYMDSRTALSLGVSAQQIRYPNLPFQDGGSYSAWAGVVHAVTPESFAIGRIGLARKEAQSPDLAYHSYSLSVGYYRDLPAGFSVYAEPGFTDLRHDEPDGFFGLRRHDRLFELRLTVLNRHIVLDRFTPRIALVLARRDSNIDIFDYGQRRLEVGVTTAF